MSRIDQVDIDELDVEYLMERESIPYKRTRGVNGMQLNIKHCPTCGDSRYRTYLNADTGRGNCFVCNKTFNKMSFIKDHFGLEHWGDVFAEAEKILKEQGWRPKRIAQAVVENTDDVQLPYSYPLPLDTGENLSYLENRGITAEYARYFHLRWCEFGFWKFIDDDGRPATQSFDNRVIIPVYDLDGTLKTFQGRDLSGHSDRKYLFPKMLPGTGRFLLNGHNVQLTPDVCMGEGGFDVAAIKIAFDGDITMRHIVAVGSFGKHLSYGAQDGNDQLGRFIRLKSSGLKRVTIMWDGEVKALISALDAAKLLTSVGIVARIALLPAGKDPNEVLPEVVRAAYWKAETWTPSLDVRWRLRNPYAT